MPGRPIFALSGGRKRSGNPGDDVLSQIYGPTRSSSGHDTEIAPVSAEEANGIVVVVRTMRIVDTTHGQVWLGRCAVDGRSQERPDDCVAAGQVCVSRLDSQLLTSRGSGAQGGRTAYNMRRSTAPHRRYFDQMAGGCGPRCVQSWSISRTRNPKRAVRRNETLSAGLRKTPEWASGF